jgi:hypothetical protein
MKRMAAMTDRFLREVERMHRLRRDIDEMTPEEADELIRGLGDDAAEDWVFAARTAQLPPPDLDWCERSSPVKNRMREFRSSGTVRVGMATSPPTRPGDPPQLQQTCLQKAQCYRTLFLPAQGFQARRNSL